MLNFILVAIACTSFSFAQEREILVSDNKTQCINQMIEWCNKMQYPQQGAGLAILSITYEDPSGRRRVFCASDSDGSNCTRDGNPWFACTSDNVLIYKGKVLTNDPTDVDDEICNTTKAAFNDIFIQNLLYDTNTTLQAEFQKGMEAFFEEWTMMQEQLKVMQDMLSHFGSRGRNDNRFLFQDPRMTTATPGEEQTNTKETNQIEKE